MASIIQNNNNTENNNSTTIKSTSSAKSTTSSSGIQTRYSFYEAEDYTVSTNGSNASNFTATTTTQQANTDATGAATSDVEQSEADLQLLRSTSAAAEDNNVGAGAVTEEEEGQDKDDEDVAGEEVGVSNAPSLDEVVRIRAIGSNYSEGSTSVATSARKFSGLSSLDVHDHPSPTATSTSAATSPTTKNPFERTIKEALQLVRARGHSREHALKVKTSSSEDTSADAISTTSATNTTGQDANVNHHHHHASIPELTAIDESGSSNNSLPLPLHPSSTTPSDICGDKGKQQLEPHLIPATNLDDRLLSPAVDVRKAVEGSKAEMFRLQSTTTTNPDSNDDNNNNNNTTDTNNNPNINDTTSAGLALATPVYSQTTPNRSTTGGDSPVHHTSAAAAPYSVVPSSPAPGKHNLANKQMRSNFSLTTAAIPSQVAGDGSGNSSANLTNGTTVYQLSAALESSTNGSVGGVNTSMEAVEARRAKLELERRWRTEEQIEKGVEKVLLAILEQATKSMDGGTGSGSNADGSSSSNNWIDTAISSFLENQQATSSFTNSGMKMRLSRIPSDVGDSQEETTEIKDNVSEKKSREEAPNAGKINNAIVQESEIDALDSAQEAETENGASMPPFTNSLDDIVEVEANDECTESSPNGGEEDDEEEDGEALGEESDKVLGPLSKEMGGTTGVVLHPDEDQEELAELENIPSVYTDASDAVTDPSTTLSPSIMESITSAVKRGPGEILAALSRDGSTATGRGGGGAKSVFSEVSEEDDVYTDTKSLVKQLYGHLLPIPKGDPNSGNGSLGTWFAQKLNAIPNSQQPEYAWDDDDPDEPGYITHTFTRAQLQHIESEYDQMLKSLQENNQRNAFIEDDLADAESMLNEKETKIDDSKPKKSKSRPSPEKANRKKKAVTGRDSPNKSSKDDKSDSSSPSRRSKSTKSDPLATNPCFPAAKPAGNGGEGELEIYHLPIIYKAHQTGFEPTKDLVLQPDTVFSGKYYVQSELGSAAFSTAYRCVDLNSGKEGDDGEMYYDEVCLKVIKNTKDFFDQSLDEIKILELLRQTGKCNENNILEMKHFFYHKEHLIIVTELLRQNLFEFGKYVMENDEPRYFTRQRLCYIARQCLVALSFIHKLGLVHSDIKPENILLASYSRARVKVIDFGSSCYLSDRQSSYIQSRSYRAPEVVLGLPYDGKIDVWSLGCVIAEMYTGQVTFQNDSVVTMLSRIEAVCGKFPRHMLENGRQSGSFFTPSGLLYEKVASDDESEVRQSSTFGEDNESSTQDEVYFNVFQPKMTTMSERLGFDPNLLSNKRRTWEDEDRALFTDFVKKLLIIDPNSRLSADQALEHPWILAGYNLTEEDLKYPPE